MPNKLLSIDPDLLEITRNYVHTQLDTMRRHGSEPTLSDGDTEDLAVRTAQYPQRIRNLDAKLAREAQKEADKHARRKPMPVLQAAEGADEIEVALLPRV